MSRCCAAAAALNLLLMVALFGSLILIPLYYQVVRHDSPLHVGLLLAPQGIGAAPPPQHRRTRRIHAPADTYWLDP
jgi:hypothetical protein